MGISSLFSKRIKDKFFSINKMGGIKNIISIPIRLGSNAVRIETAY